MTAPTSVDACGFVNAADNPQSPVKSAAFPRFAPLPDTLVKHPLYQALSAESDRVSERIDDTMNRVHRVGVVLRLMQFRYQRSDSLSQHLPPDDVAALLDLMLEMLPDAPDDIETPPNDLDRLARRSLFEALTGNEGQRIMLEAMTVAARRDATLGELDAAAQSAWDLAQTDPAFEPDWRRFSAAIESQGYRLEVAQMGNFNCAQIVTPERSKAWRQRDRALKAIARSIDACERASARVPAAASGSKEKHRTSPPPT
jgi:hypothetical protein